MRSSASASSSTMPSISSARSQSIASAIPGGFWTSRVSYPRHRAHHGHRERLGRALHAPPDDLYLTLRVRVVDPVIQAAALDGVVEVPRPVARQHDHRRVRGADRAQLRDRHGRLGQQLEQERLEVVVGAVDLVDQQHRRPRARVLQRPQQRAPDQVVGAEQVGLGELLAGAVRQPDAQAAGADSSTRRAPRRRRCRRSTAAARAACRAPAPAPWPPPSCRPRPPPPAAAAAGGGGSGTATWPGPRRPGSRRSREAARASRRPARSTRDRSLRRLGAALHRGPHAGRGARHVDVVDAVRLVQGVDHGVDDRRRRARRSGTPPRPWRPAGGAGRA